MFNKGLLVVLIVQHLRNTCFQGTTWGGKEMKRLLLTYVTTAICAGLTVIVAVVACQNDFRCARPLTLGANLTKTTCSSNITPTTLDAKSSRNWEEPSLNH